MTPLREQIRTGNNAFHRSGHEQRALGELGDVETIQPDTDIALGLQRAPFCWGNHAVEATGTAQTL